MSEPSPHERLSRIGVSPSVSAAYDLLTDDGMSSDQAAELVVAAERSGRDAEAFARHMLKLRRVAREMKR